MISLLNYEFLEVYDSVTKSDGYWGVWEMDVIINKEQIIYYISELPKDLLEKIQEKYPKYDHKRPAKNGFTYLANHCEHENCDRVQGDKYLYDDEEGIFYNVDDLEPKYFIGLNENTEKLEYISKFFN